MIKEIVFSAFLFIHLPLQMIFAENPEWINYTCGKEVNCIAIEGDTVWAGTGGGLVQLDMNTEQTICYNKANSGLPDNDVLSTGRLL